MRPVDDICGPVGEGRPVARPSVVEEQLLHSTLAEPLGQPEHSDGGVYIGSDIVALAGSAHPRMLAVFYAADKMWLLIPA